MRIFLLLFFISFAVFGQTRVIDGDTFYYNGEKIRLKNIDCPELSSKMGIECKIFTENALKRAKTILVRRYGKDFYGRTLAVVFIDGKDLGYYMVSEGYAFVYDRYNSDLSYKEAEQTAKKKKSGIHKFNLQKPWNYRHGKSRY